MNTVTKWPSILFTLTPLFALACSSNDDDPVAPGAGGSSSEHGSGGQRTDDTDDDTGGTGAGGTGAQAGAGGSASGGMGGEGGDDPGCALQLERGAAPQTIELCSPEPDPVRHVRIAGLHAGSGHASVQFFLGFDEPPVSPQAPLDAGQLKLMLYSGTPHDIHLTFGDGSATITGDHSFTAEPSTLCFDLHDGSEERGPRIVLWVDGENGADCGDFATLTETSAYGVADSWEGAMGPLALHKNMYLYQAGGIQADPEVDFQTQPVASCETTWQDNSDWQRLCSPLGGAHHFRVERIQATTSSRYFYLVVGEVAEPTGAPKSLAEDGKILLTGGQSHSGASWTWFQFGGDSSSQMTFENDDGELYVDAPTTVCAEAADFEGSARLVFWATGAEGADCDDFETLTLESALHVAEWDAPLATGLWNYVKTSNAGISLSKVIVSNSRLAP